MSDNITEIENHNIKRLGNEASKKLSQECIETALLSLMKEKSIEDITVSDVVKKAGVSRAAFYRNYSSKQEVLIHSCSKAIEDVAEAIAPIVFENNPHEFWETVFQVAEKYAEGFKMIVDAGYGQKVLEEMTKVISLTVPEDHIPQQYDMAFWCGGVFNMLIKWINDEMKISAKEMADIGIYIIEQ